MKIIVAGSRDITNYAVVKKAILDSGWIDKETEIVSGMARGVDMLAVRFAQERGLELAQFPADWHKYGKPAGMIRNEEMAQYADALIAIWDGRSFGTRGMIEIAKSYKLRMFIVRTDVAEAVS